MTCDQSSDDIFNHQFQDVYFSAEDGLAETHHVFLDGNDLPQAWQAKQDFVIAETGFGTGLNFLATSTKFKETASANQKLHYISVEQYPLSKAEVERALQKFSKRIDQDIYEGFLKKYPLNIPGGHKLEITSNISLTIFYGDVNKVLPELNAKVDCWFLDGFTPSKNPEMWTDIVFQSMAKLSHHETTFSTFTAAGFVKRGLEKAGFLVSKKKGFGKKRDMLSGIYILDQTKLKKKVSKRASNPSIAIVGAGMAGIMCAYHLKKVGLESEIYEQYAEPAPKASGNSLGMYNPRFSAFYTAEAEFYTAGFFQAYRLFCRLKEDGNNIDFDPCGALHLINSKEKETRFNKMIANWNWPDDELKILEAEEASQLAGIDLKQDALFLKSSGFVSPYKLCLSLSKSLKINYNQSIQSLSDIDAEIIILANAYEADKLMPYLPIHSVRGQVSSLKATPTSKNIKCNIHYGGYLSKPRDGIHVAGASFQRWLTHNEVLEEDHCDNIERLKENIDVLRRETFDVIDGRAGLRTSSKDRFPIAGEVNIRDLIDVKLKKSQKLYLSLAHGSHGLVSSVICGQIIADQLMGLPLSVGQTVIDQLSFHRFENRKKKK